MLWQLLNLSALSSVKVLDYKKIIGFGEVRTKTFGFILETNQ